MKLCVVSLFVIAAISLQIILVAPLVCGRTLQDFDDQKAYYHNSPPRTSHSGSHSSHSKGSSFPSPPHQGGCAKTPSHSSSSSTPKPRDGSYGTPTTPSHGSRSATTPATTPPTSSHATTPTMPSHSTTPSTPSHTTTPATPSIPGFPSITATCDFWRTHPSMIFGILGQWSNIGNLFGFPATSIFGRNPSVPQALGNARNDGYGALFREGTASLLNSMANPSFPLTTQVVRDRFNQALSSEKTASAEAQRFRLANEGA